MVESRAAVAVDATEEDRETLQQFFHRYVAPFLEPRGTRGSPLTNPGRRAVLFEELRRSLPPPMHDTTRDLDALCDQRSQLETQRRLHHWLHGWLYVHVPLSMAMTFLTAVHAVTALLY